MHVYVCVGRGGVGVLTLFTFTGKPWWKKKSVFGAMSL